MYASVAEIKAANRAAGQHYFDKEAMRFFNSRIGRRVIAGRYFIDSTQFCARGECLPRRYSVCMADARGHVQHVSEPGAFLSERAALAYARTLS